MTSPYLSDQKSILLSTDIVDSVKLKNYLIPNLSELSIKNEIGTHIAILKAHGGVDGRTSRDTWEKAWDYKIMDGYEYYVEDPNGQNPDATYIIFGNGVRYRYESYVGYKNDPKTNKMTFHIVDVYEGLSVDSCTGSFDATRLIQTLNHLQNPRQAPKFSPDLCVFLSSTLHDQNVKIQLQNRYQNEWSQRDPQYLFIEPITNITTDEELENFGNWLKDQLRTKLNSNNPQEKLSSAAEIAILGAQGPKHFWNDNNQIVNTISDNARDAKFLVKYWKLMYGFRLQGLYDPNTGVQTADRQFVGLKYEEHIKDLKFQPIDIFHNRTYQSSIRVSDTIQSVFDTIDRRLAKLENPSLRTQYRPFDLIVMQNCHSLFNNVSRALMTSGIFPEMIARKDLQKITKKSDVKLSNEQRHVIEGFRRGRDQSHPRFAEKPFKDLFLCGPSGSGKTLLGVLRVKQMMWEWIKDGQSSWPNRPDIQCGTDIKNLTVYVFTDAGGLTNGAQLLKQMKETYFSSYVSNDLFQNQNSNGIKPNGNLFHFCEMKKFMEENGLHYDDPIESSIDQQKQPNNIQRIINFANEKTNRNGKKLILFFDEASIRTNMTSTQDPSFIPLTQDICALYHSMQTDSRKSVQNFSTLENNSDSVGVVVCVSPLRPAFPTRERSFDVPCCDRKEKACKEKEREDVEFEVVGPDDFDSIELKNRYRNTKEIKDFIKHFLHMISNPGDPDFVDKNGKVFDPEKRRKEESKENRKRMYPNIYPKSWGLIKVDHDHEEEHFVPSCEPPHKPVWIQNDDMFEAFEKVYDHAKILEESLSMTILFANKQLKENFVQGIIASQSPFNRIPFDVNKVHNMEDFFGCEDDVICCIETKDEQRDGYQSLEAWNRAKRKLYVVSETNFRYKDLYKKLFTIEEDAGINVFEGSNQ